MAYESGTSHSTAKTRAGGIGMGAGDFAIAGGSATTQATTMSIVAQKVSPPKRRTVSGWIWLLGLLFGIGTKGLTILVPVAMWYFANKWNNTEYPKLMAAWEDSWLCHKCGNSFRFDSMMRTATPA